MIIHDFAQNSPEWIEAHRGVITASSFSKILTAKTMKLSKSAEEIEHKIIAEILTDDETGEFFGNQWTERGHELEPDAVAMYEMLKDVETTPVGFITTDDGLIGCSPDRLIGEDGGLEIKCLSAHKHIEMLVNKSIDEEHKPQVQGCLMVTERKWWDVMAYHPQLPPSIVRVVRDEEYIEKLGNGLNFVLDNIKTKIKAIKGES
jgi:hypothetical protein